MSKSVNLILFALLTGLLACEQNPYANREDAIRNAVPPSRKAEKPVINEQELKIITAQNSYEVSEDQELKVVFTPKILKPGLTGSLVAENLEAFPGASFDVETGEFIWTPGKSFLAETELERSQDLVVSLFTEPTDEFPTMYRRSLFRISVVRELVDPSIEARDNISSLPIEEGGFIEFNAVVKDPTAINTELGQPRLVAVQQIGSIPFSFSKLSAVPDARDPSIWRLKYRIGLDKVFLSESTDFSFGVYAVSRFNRVSKTFNVTGKASIVPQRPVSTLTGEAFPVRSGSLFTFGFAVYSAQGKGRIEIGSSPEDIDLSEFEGNGFATLVCEAGPTPAIKQCTFTWLAPTGITEAKEFSAKIKVSSRAMPNMVSKNDFTENFKLTVRLLP